ncbi:hypothetical protein GYB22_02900 [bacterium]|nr:hypothetical protein [bacterium]
MINRTPSGFTKANRPINLHDFILLYVKKSMRFALLFLILIISVLPHEGIPTSRTIHHSWEYSEAIKDSFEIIFTEPLNADTSSSILLIYTDANILFGRKLRSYFERCWNKKLFLNYKLLGIGNSGKIPVKRRRDLTSKNRDHARKTSNKEFLSFFDLQIEELTLKYLNNIDSTLYTGHSFGGLFGLEHALRSNSSCDKYILFSPSIWMNKHQIIQEYKDDYSGAALFEIYAGKKEKYNLIQSSCMKFEKMAMEKPGLKEKFKYSIVPGNHISSVEQGLLLAFPSGLRIEYKK